MFDVFSISSSGMDAQRLRMNVIASNLANVETTRTAEGGAYRRKDVVFSATEQPFGKLLEAGLEKYSTGVQVMGVVQDQRPFKQAYEPNHPDADSNGYVAYPNVNAAEEMVNMISASRSYDANVQAFKAAREMATRAIEIIQ